MGFLALPAQTDYSGCTSSAAILCNGETPCCPWGPLCPSTGCKDHCLLLQQQSPMKLTFTLCTSAYRTPACCIERRGCSQRQSEETRRGTSIPRGIYRAFPWRFCKHRRELNASLSVWVWVCGCVAIRGFLAVHLIGHCQDGLKQCFSSLAALRRVAFNSFFLMCNSGSLKAKEDLEFPTSAKTPGPLGRQVMSGS